MGEPAQSAPRWAAPVRACAGALVGGLAGGWMAALVVGTLALAWPRLASRRRARTAQSEQATSLIEVLDLAARAVRSGLPASAALDEAGRLAGLPPGERPPGAGPGLLTERVDGWATATSTAPARLVAAAVGVATAGSADAARAFDAAARALRARRAVSSEVHAAAAQARASALLLGLAPAAVLGISVLADRSLPARLVGDPFACASAVLGAALEAAGLVWMRRMVDRCTGEGR